MVGIDAQGARIIIYFHLWLCSSLLLIYSHRTGFRNFSRLPSFLLDYTQLRPLPLAVPRLPLF